MTITLRSVVRLCTFNIALTRRDHSAYHTIVEQALHTAKKVQNQMLHPVDCLNDRAGLLEFARSSRGRSGAIVRFWISGWVVKA